jgi:hypothetical protein
MEMRFRGCEISILSGEIEILTFWAGGRNKIDRNQFHAKKAGPTSPALWFFANWFNVPAGKDWNGSGRQV